MNDRETIVDLRRAWNMDSATTSADYVLLARVGVGYAARTPQGQSAIVVELPTVGGAVGRSAAGCSLVAHRALQFSFGGREWTGPGAGLVCMAPDLDDAFTVLAADVLGRLASKVEWSAMVTLVEQWQALLAPKGKPTPEREIGLWGELWLIASSANVDRLLASWRGPEGDSTDFFVEGRAAEVKTSRTRRQHDVSLSQVTTPVGDHDAWVLSVWVKASGESGRTVADLAGEILGRATDVPEALRRLGRAGFTHADRREFVSRYALLGEPEWYSVGDVPRVRAVDPGVTRVRYRTVLDERCRVDAAGASTLWRHFLGHEYGTGS